MITTFFYIFGEAFFPAFLYFSRLSCHTHYSVSGSRRFSSLITSASSALPT